MINCAICDREFKNILGLAMHIHSFHKEISIEEYYIQYISTNKTDGYCKLCGKKTKFYTLSNGYRNYCSIKCARNSKEVKEKYKQTNIEKYGTENPSQSKEIKNKIKNTNITRYGVDHISKSKKFKDKKKKKCLDKYGVDHYFKTNEFKEKYKNTCIDKYGVENVSKIKSIKIQKKQTTMKNYGVEIPTKNKEILDKIKQTNLKKYGYEYVLQNEKYKEKRNKTCLKKYGTENPFQSEEIKAKAKKTIIKKYGVDNYSKTDEFKEKCKETYLSHYGVNHYSKTDEYKEKIKKTCLNKYGVPFVTQLDEFKEKIKKTNLEKYGNTCCLKNIDIADKIFKIKRNNYFNNIKNGKFPYIEPLFDINDYKGAGIENKYRFRCKTCGTEFEDHLDDGRIPMCPSCFPFNRSKLEIEIYEYIKYIYNGEIICNDRNIIKPKELDIIIPEKMIAIEVNGTYYHSEKFGRGDDYHENKVKLCENAGYKLYFIWEDEWKEQQEETKIKIKNIIFGETNDE